MLPRCCGLIWFKEVGTENSNPLQVLNLRGNVSEYQYDADENQFYIVGGSALSPAEQAWDDPYKLDEASGNGFSDVGFRIVFNAPIPLPGRVLLEGISQAPNLQPGI